MPEPQDDAPARTSRSAKPRKTGSQLIVAALIGVLGFAITVQVNRDEEETRYASLRGVELVEMLKSIDAANDRLAGQVDDLTATRDELLSSRDRSAEARKQAERRTDELAILAGSVGAEGPGIRMVINDSDRSIDSGVLLDVVEELRAAGAEAIVVNGSARVIAQTYFLDDEEGIRIGGREVSPPYVIEAIGDAATLEEAMAFRGGSIDRVNSRGGTASTRQLERVTITALADVKSPEYARPDADAESGQQQP